MNKDEFLKILTENHYTYKLVGDSIVVDHSEHVELAGIYTLPENVIFKNNGYVSLSDLIELPESVKFENNGEVYLKTGLYKRGHYRHPKAD